MIQLSKKAVLLFAVIIVLIGAGAFVGGTKWGYAKRIYSDNIAAVFGDSPYEAPDIDLGPFWKAWGLIDEKYVFPDSPSEEEKLWGAITGLVESVPDPYTTFLPPKEAAIFEEDINGNFGGVGIEIGMRDGILTIISPLKGTPGDHAGLKSGDMIVGVDGEQTAGLSIDEMVVKIRGEIGTSVTLTVFRRGKDIQNSGDTFDVKIVRAKIEIPTVDTRIEDGVFILQLYNFSGQSPPLFERALSDFKKSGTNKLIIDLRGNPGGFLEASIEIGSLFLPEGKVIVRENTGEGNDEIVHRSKGYRFFSGGGMPKIVVLVNKGSASASEILAAALQEQGLATVVGEKTFGKGSVQELVPLTNNTFIKITVAKWLTPAGRSIEEEGVKIDIMVEEGDDENKDLQLEKAINILNS